MEEYQSSVQTYGRLIAAFFIGAVLSFFLFKTLEQRAVKKEVVETVSRAANCSLRAYRLRNNFQYIKPLLFVDQTCESPMLSNIKMNIEETVGALKKSGTLNTASVYVRDFDNGQWIDFNENEVFHPASLSKLPVMITILKMVEKDPALLDRELVYQPPKDRVLPKQNYVEATITPGKKYKVRELLRYMISYSDNPASLLLASIADLETYNNLMIDHGLSLLAPGESIDNMMTNTKSYSVFMRILFNATFLKPELCEFGMSLLAASSFKDGFQKGLPANTKLVHKFGEWDDGRQFELHETGIIYIDKKAYLVTIMTRGNSREKLPDAVGAITKGIYGKFTGI